MTEIPEHLRKRAEEARAKAAAASGASTDAPSGDDAPPSEAESKIPAHLLERSKAAKAKAAGGDAGGGGGGTATAVATAPAAAATAAPPLATGPGGHTQRLLTVVKSGSIQDVKATPQDKVHVWPHLLVVAAWRVAWSAQGYGVYGIEELYTDPGAHPLRFALIVLQRAPLYMLGQWTGFPAEVHWAVSARFVSVMWCAGVLVLMLLAVIVIPAARRSRVVRFWALGMVMAATVAS